MEIAKFVRNVLIGSVVIGLCNSVHLYTNYANQVKDIFYFTQTNSKYSLRSGSRNSVGASFYRPQTKLQEGNVLTCVCQSVRGGGSAIPPEPYPTHWNNFTPDHTILPRTVNPPRRTIGYSWQAGGTHPTGMPSCYCPPMKFGAR